jgi:hypothetical protein
MDHFDDPSDNFTHELSVPCMLNVLGCWDMSIWTMLKDAEDAEAMYHPKTSNKKCKKQETRSNLTIVISKSYGLIAIYERLSHKGIIPCVIAIKHHRQ